MNSKKFVICNGLDRLCRGNQRQAKHSYKSLFFFVLAGAAHGGIRYVHGGLAGTVRLSASSSGGMQLIAEGVETSAQRDLLAAAGCDYGQGYLFSPALPAAVFDAFMAQWPRPPV